jgi:hypothetical protein
VISPGTWTNHGKMMSFAEKKNGKMAAKKQAQMMI